MHVFFLIALVRELSPDLLEYEHIEGLIIKATIFAPEIKESLNEADRGTGLTP